MTFDQAAARRIASQLDDSARERQSITQLSITYPQISIADAYAVQQAWVALKLSQGRRIHGHKVGLTSRAMQLAFDIDEPDYGVLFDDMFYEDGSVLPMRDFIVPQIEVELAFVLKSDLKGPNVRITDVYAATDYVLPALEIIDARFDPVCPETGASRKVVDTIADNAASAGVVLGGRPVALADVDPRWVGCVLSRNGQIQETGLAVGVMNHPANGVVWLANKLTEHGITLRAGQVILSGSFTRAVPAQKGDVFHADYGPLGSIQCRFGS